MSKITVLITCYSEGGLLLRAIESLRKQSDNKFKVIVVNDASKDDATNLCCQKIEQTGINVIWRKSNGGLSAARNTGFECIGSGIVIPLDADDTLPDDTIAVIRKTFSKNPTALYIFGNYMKTYLDTNKTEFVDCRRISKESGSLDYKKLLNEWIFFGQSPCRWELWNNIGGYSQEFSYTLQDMDFWLKVFEKNYYGCYIDKIIYNWHLSPDGMNANVNLFDVNLIKYRHLYFYCENSEFLQENILNGCFSTFYAYGQIKLIKEIADKYFSYLTVKNKLIAVLSKFFSKKIESRIKKINKERKIY